MKGMKTKEVKSFAQVDIRELRQAIICVYKNPEDFPDKCVARIFEGGKPTNIIITRETVDELRKDIKAAFPYMIPIPRSAADYKSFVESWI